MGIRTLRLHYKKYKKIFASKAISFGGVAKVIKAHLYGMPESKNLSEIKMQNCEIIEADI